MPKAASSSYKRPAGGKLVLKGGESLTKKKKKSHKRSHSAAAVSTEKISEENDYELVKVKGSGRLITSGTTVMGREDSKFLQELSIGDALIIQHPHSLQEETRIVKMVLSDVSISISSPFSTDLISSLPYYYIKAPKVAVDQASIEAATNAKKSQEEKFAFGTYAGGTSAGSVYTYRVRTKTAYGGYKIVTEKQSDDVSREDLLDKRRKMKADRYCN